MRSRVIILVSLVCGVVALWLGFRWYDQHQRDKRLEARIAELRANGELRPEDPDAAQVPEDQNAFHALLDIHRRISEGRASLPENPFSPWARRDESREAMSGYFAEQDAILEEIATALRLPFYTAPELDYRTLDQLAKGGHASEDDLNATSLRTCVPIDLAQWLEAWIELRGLRPVTRDAATSALESLLSLAERQVAPGTVDIVLRLILGSIALESFTNALQSGWRASDVAPAWMERIAHIAPKPDPLLALRADRALNIHRVGDDRPPWLHEYFESLDAATLRLERDPTSLEAYFQPSLLEDFRELTERANLVRVALTATFFAAHEGHWPPDFRSLDELLAASGGPPADELERLFDMQVDGERITLDRRATQPEDPEPWTIRMSLDNPR